MVFQLIYKSTAIRHFMERELLDLLETSRVKNARLQITGMLLYHNGHFLQLLEGDEQAVRELYGVIAEDERHKWVSLVMTGPAAERDFADWTMGFRDLDECATAPVGWTSLMESEGVPQGFADSPSYAKALLLAFRNREGEGETGGLSDELCR